MSSSPHRRAPVHGRTAAETQSAVSDAVLLKWRIAAATISPELWTREARPPDIVAELSAMRRLAETLEKNSGDVLQVCAEALLDLCRADTCGVSIAEHTHDGKDVFRWTALAGQLRPHLNRRTPRYFSPCGVTVDVSTPVLMRNPELVYDSLEVGAPFHDMLLVPLPDAGDAAEGAIWIVAHTRHRKFDREDARAMQHLGAFATLALRLGAARH